jgi:hypothetical protein
MGGNETMTDKRFTLRKPDIDNDIDCEEIADNGEWITYGDVVDLLNEQDQRIKELTEDNKQYEILVESLKDKNQKLKLRLKDLGVEYY